MKIFLYVCLDILANINFLSISFLISLSLVIISYLYLNRASNINKIKKKKFYKLFSLDPRLDKEINNFRSQQTKLIFHFIRFFNNNKSYKSIYFPSQNQLFNIKGKNLIISYIDKQYPFNYNVAEKLALIDEKGNKKNFIIVVNKYVENHYNIIIDRIENKKTYSLEIIVYSKIKKFLKEIIQSQNFKLYKKENYLKNILRFSIINAGEEDLYDIYSINMEKEKKSKIDKNFFSALHENLLLNIIYSKDEKIVFRRIFQNKEENINFHLKKEEINLLKDLYEKVIKKYINTDPEDEAIINNFKNEFISFDKTHGYKDNYIKETIERDLRNINIKFRCTPFYIWIYDKDDISLEELKLTEYLCYLNLLLLDLDKFLERFQNLIEKKNLIFNKYSCLTNKDKSLILINLLTNEKKNKSNYKFRNFYDLPEKCPYVQSELFFRKTVSQLNDDSSLSFLYLQLNSGSGEDYLTRKEHYKIRMIPLIEIKFHLLKKFFYPYFFTYDSNNNIMALNNVNTQILAFNESNDIGYSRPKKLCELPSENNMIKLAFLKFHEKAHIKFNGNYYDNKEFIYLLNDNFQLIDNKNRNNSNNDAEILETGGESGNALDFFIFNDYATLCKLMATTKNLSTLNNINLLTRDNFDELRKIVQKLTKNVKLKIPYDKRNELSKKYKEKIKYSKNFKNKKISEIRLSDLDIEELY